VDPFDAWRHAARRGVRVVELHQLIEHGFPQAGIRYFSRNPRVSAAYDIVDGSPFVLLFGECAPTRRLSDLAHELAHHELGHRPTEPFDSIGCRRWNPVQEEEANWLAGCLLIPASGALAVLKRGLSFGDAAVTFGVSLKMFTWRANMTGAARKHGLKRSVS
jgi:Zn-dependent peptidase ImmA (M78 family)